MKTKEKRRSRRLKIPLMVSYHMLPQKKTLIEKIFAKDISGGGIGLKLNFPLEKGTRLKTLLYFPSENRPVSSISEVVWCKKARGHKTFDIGIRHIKILPKDRERFVFLFCETMIDYFLFPGSFISLKK